MIYIVDDLYTLLLQGVRYPLAICFAGPSSIYFPCVSNGKWDSGFQNFVGIFPRNNDDTVSIP